MREALSAEDVATAVEALPGWSGDAAALQRDVVVAEDDRQTLRDAIEAVAEDSPARPRIEATTSGLLVVLSSPDGGVTPAEVELAGQLDRLFAGGVAWSDY